MIQVIEDADPSLRQEVSDYLAAAPAPSGVCFEHDPRWLSILHKALAHRPVMLIARDGGGDGDGPICGYLPLVLVASRWFGRFLVSLPYLNRAGVVAQKAEHAQQLIDKAVELTRLHNVHYLELRHSQPTEHQDLGAKRDEKVRMVLELPDDSAALWKTVHSKVRNQVRKGDKIGLSIRWGSDELLDDFYEVFAVNMRDLGTPVYSRKLFGSILSELGSQSELAVVYCQNQAVAGALLVHDQRLEKPAITQVPSASSLRRYNHTNANMWMYFQLLLRSIERGSRQFDFGRSSVDSGTYRFKKQWGAQPRPTVWQYHVRRGDIDCMRPETAKNRRRIRTWQKLPVWVTRLVGPTIVRGIP